MGSKVYKIGEALLGECTGQVDEAVGRGGQFHLAWIPTKGAGVLEVSVVQVLGQMASPMRALDEAKSMVEQAIKDYIKFKTEGMREDAKIIEKHAVKEVLR